ncbi:MAG: hypothetical protein GEU89_15000 [Kiloniellaceae bacterium]|nr:hypothetical protein [Kiloniellaceae bacterium]
MRSEDSAMNGTAKLRLFGGFSLCDARGQTVSLTLRKTEALIAYLASGASRSHQRDQLATLLWSESSQSSALQSLRQARLMLMRNLEPHQLSIVNFSRREIHLDDTALEIDAAAFVSLQQAGDQDSLVRAIDLYRGDFLAGLDIESEAFDEWLQPTRAWYRSQVEAALQRLLALQEQVGPHESSVRTAKRILALDPLREDMYRWLMRAFAATGHRTSALAAYDACRSVLREELDVSPEAETEELYKAILRGAETKGPPVQSAPGALPPKGTRSHANEGSLAPDEAAAARAVASFTPLSNLSNAAMEVLQIAAICQNHFSLRLLDGMSERPAGRNEAAIRELRRAALLQWDDRSQTGKLSDPMRENVLGPLLPSHRKHLHYAAAIALEEIAGPEAHESCFEIAEHFRQAGKWAQAAPHQLRLAHLEVDQGNLESAEPQLKKARADISKLPEGAARERLEIEAAVLGSSLAELRGDLVRAEQILVDIWPTLKRGGSTQLWIAALQARSRLRFRRGQFRQSYSLLRMIPQSCNSGKTESVWMPAERFADSAGIAADETGRPTAMLQRQRTAGLRAGQVADAALSAFCQAKQKKFAAAYTACDQALRLSEDLPDTTCLIVSLQTLGIIQVWDGEAATALQALDRAQELARDRGDLLRQYTCHGYRGYALVNAGRSAEGIEAFSEALAMAAELRLQFMTAMFSAWLAEALIDTGEYDQALGVARNAVRLANERNEAWARSVALRVVGQALSLSPADDGGKLVDRILRCAQEMQSSLGLTLETDRTGETRAEVARALH